MALPNEPLTRAEQYLNRTVTGGGTIPDEPLTRVEMYLNKIATGDGDVPEVPLTRMEQYLAEIAENGGGGGVDPESITLRTLNVSQNGTTNAPDGVAYNKVVVNVPQGTTPTGTKTINISANGTTTEDVAAYANAQIVVAVPIPTYPVAENNSFGGGS